MNKEKLILKKYVEGEITTEEFWDFYKSNRKIQKILSKEKYIGAKSYYSPGIIEKHFNVNDIFERFGLYEEIRACFIRQKKKFNFYNKDEDYITLINKIQPKYVDIRNQSFWDKILASVPQNIKKSEKIKLLKEETKKRFPYQSKPPKWIQSPEWPIEDNNPLKFINQTKIDDGFKYSFINEITKQTKTIEQYY